MNRQEAAEVLTALKQRLEMSDDYDYCYYSRDVDAYDTALAALREPALDENGLVPCGCGGVPLLEDWEWGDDNNMWECWCPKCRIKTGFYTKVDAARSAWNRAMGWKGGAE